MGGGRRYLVPLILLQLLQGLLGEQQVQPIFEVMPTYMVVNPGESAIFLCKLHGPIDSCQFTVGGLNLFLKPGRGKNGIFYYGQGLHMGDCGMNITNAQEQHNGNISCSVAPDSADPTGQTGHMQLVLAIAPQKPELEVSLGTENHGTSYRESDVLTASCVIRDGRPAANMSWYMGDELITEGLRIATETCTPQKKELCTIHQNLTRTLLASDDKKFLRCVASHHGLNGHDLIAEYKINVFYPPKPSPGPIERFGLVLGQTGRVPITIEANPKPVVMWEIGDDVVHEGNSLDRYSVQPTVYKGPGLYESVLMIEDLQHGDILKKIKVTAHNDMGNSDYKVTISTSPEPKVLEMGAGLIIVIATAVILIVLIIVGVFFARAKGKLCFAGRESQRIAGESSDTESAEQQQDQRPKVSFVTVFTKRNEKAPAAKEVTKSESDDASVEIRKMDKDNGENVVYAELDLGTNTMYYPVPTVKVHGEDDKTEYAEIIHTAPPTAPASPTSTAPASPSTPGSK